MFDGFWQTGVAFFIVWNWWSVVAIAIVISFAFVGWKALTVPPRRSPDRVAYDQNRNNIKRGKTPFRRFVEALLICVFSIMGATLFCIAVYNILS